MDYTLSNRMKDAEGSLIMSILASMNAADVIAFSGGNPSAEAFPVDAIRALVDEALRENPARVLQYGTSAGYDPLRGSIADRLNRLYPFDCSASDVLICSGAQQAADVAAKVLVNEGDVVICEDPSFPGCLATFHTYGAKLVGVPMDRDGIDLDKLEAALKDNPNAKLIYLIPTFQNPTGITMSLEKRRAVYQLAKRFCVPILEDDPYGDLRFSGETIPPIKAMDTEDLVIYAGSFSKLMAPAFRVGFAVAPKALMEKFVIAKQASDVHSNVLFQYVCHRFMADYDFEGHIEKLRAIYQSRAQLMLTEMDKQFHPAVTYTRPEGGLFIMAYLPDGQDSQVFCEAGARRGVATVPGIAFAPDMSRPSNAFRLNFSTPSPEQIVEGIAILGRLTHDTLA